MPEQVKRYALRQLPGDVPTASPNGIWVRFSDYEKLERLASLKHDSLKRQFVSQKQRAEMAEAERDQAFANLEATKQAWHKADEERIKEHTAIYAEATKKRQELESQLAELRAAVGEFRTSPDPGGAAYERLIQLTEQEPVDAAH